MGLSKIKSLALLGIVMLGTHAIAFPTGGVNSPCLKKDSFSAISELRQNIVWMDTKEDPRDLMSKNAVSNDVEKFVDIKPNEQDVINKTFGNFICKGIGTNKEGSASTDLGSSLDDIILPKHAFDGMNLKTCYFLTFAGENIPVSITAADIQAYKDWNEGGRHYSGDRMKLKLARPVAGIQADELIPFASSDFSLSKDEPVIVVTGYQLDWNKQRKLDRKKMREPLAYPCVPKVGIRKGVAWTTNCAADPGGSGGKMLVRDENGRLVKVAMLTNLVNTTDDGKKVKNGSEYDPKSMFSVFLRVDSEFVSDFTIHATSASP